MYSRFKVQLQTGSFLLYIFLAFPLIAGGITDKPVEKIPLNIQMIASENREIAFLKEAILAYSSDQGIDTYWQISEHDQLIREHTAGTTYEYPFFLKNTEVFDYGQRSFLLQKVTDAYKSARQVTVDHFVLYELMASTGPVRISEFEFMSDSPTWVDYGTDGERIVGFSNRENNDVNFIRFQIISLQTKHVDTFQYLLSENEMIYSIFNVRFDPSTGLVMLLCTLYKEDDPYNHYFNLIRIDSASGEVVDRSPISFQDRKIAFRLYEFEGLVTDQQDLFIHFDSYNDSCLYRYNLDEPLPQNTVLQDLDNSNLDEVDVLQFCSGSEGTLYFSGFHKESAGIFKIDADTMHIAPAVLIDQSQNPLTDIFSIKVYDSELYGLNSHNRIFRISQEHIRARYYHSPEPDDVSKSVVDFSIVNDQLHYLSLSSRPPFPDILAGRLFPYIRVEDTVISRSSIDGDDIDAFLSHNGLSDRDYSIFHADRDRIFLYHPDGGTREQSEILVLDYDGNIILQMDISEDGILNIRFSEFYNCFFVHTQGHEGADYWKVYSGDMEYIHSSFFPSLYQHYLSSFQQYPGIIDIAADENGVIYLLLSGSGIFQIDPLDKDFFL